MNQLNSSQSKELRTSPELKKPTFEALAFKRVASSLLSPQINKDGAKTAQVKAEKNPEAQARQENKGFFGKVQNYAGTFFKSALTSATEPVKQIAKNTEKFGKTLAQDPSLAVQRLFAENLSHKKEAEITEDTQATGVRQFETAKNVMTAEFTSSIKNLVESGKIDCRDLTDPNHINSLKTGVSGVVTEKLNSIQNNSSTLATREYLARLLESYNGEGIYTPQSISEILSNPSSSEYQTLVEILTSRLEKGFQLQLIAQDDQNLNDYLKSGSLATEAKPATGIAGYAKGFLMGAVVLNPFTLSTFGPAVPIFGRLVNKRMRSLYKQNTSAKEFLEYAQKEGLNYYEASASLVAGLNQARKSGFWGNILNDMQDFTGINIAGVDSQTVRIDGNSPTTVRALDTLISYYTSQQKEFAEQAKKEQEAAFESRMGAPKSSNESLNSILNSKFYLGELSSDNVKGSDDNIQELRDRLQALKESTKRNASNYKAKELLTAFCNSAGTILGGNLFKARGLGTVVGGVASDLVTRKMWQGVATEAYKGAGFVLSETNESIQNLTDNQNSVGNDGLNIGKELETGLYATNIGGQNLGGIAGYGRNLLGFNSTMYNGEVSIDNKEISFTTASAHALPPSLISPDTTVLSLKDGDFTVSLGLSNEEFNALSKSEQGALKAEIISELKGNATYTNTDFSQGRNVIDSQGRFLGDGKDGILATAGNSGALYSNGSALTAIVGYNPDGSAVLDSVTSDNLEVVSPQEYSQIYASVIDQSKITNTVLTSLETAEQQEETAFVDPYANLGTGTASFGDSSGVVLDLPPQNTFIAAAPVEPAYIPEPAPAPIEPYNPAPVENYSPEPEPYTPAVEAYVPPAAEPSYSVESSNTFTPYQETLPPVSDSWETASYAEPAAEPAYVPPAETYNTPAPVGSYNPEPEPYTPAVEAYVPPAAEPAPVYDNNSSWETQTAPDIYSGGTDANIGNGGSDDITPEIPSSDYGFANTKLDTFTTPINSDFNTPSGEVSISDTQPTSDMFSQSNQDGYNTPPAETTQPVTPETSVNESPSTPTPSMEQTPEEPLTPETPTDTTAPETPTPSLGQSPLEEQPTNEQNPHTYPYSGLYTENGSKVGSAWVDDNGNRGATVAFAAPGGFLDNATPETGITPVASFSQNQMPLEGNSANDTLQTPTSSDIVTGNESQGGETPASVPATIIQTDTGNVVLPFNTEDNTFRTADDINYSNEIQPSLWGSVEGKGAINPKNLPAGTMHYAPNTNLVDAEGNIYDINAKEGQLTPIGQRKIEQTGEGQETTANITDTYYQPSFGGPNNDTLEDTPQSVATSKGPLSLSPEVTQASNNPFSGEIDASAFGGNQTPESSTNNTPAQTNAETFLGANNFGIQGPGEKPFVSGTIENENQTQFNTANGQPLAEGTSPNGTNRIPGLSGNGARDVHTPFTPVNVNGFNPNGSGNFPLGQVGHIGQMNRNTSDDASTAFVSPQAGIFNQNTPQQKSTGLEVNEDVNFERFNGTPTGIPDFARPTTNSIKPPDLSVHTSGPHIFNKETGELTPFEGEVQKATDNGQTIVDVVRGPNQELAIKPDQRAKLEQTFGNQNAQVGFSGKGDLFTKSAEQTAPGSEIKLSSSQGQIFTDIPGNRQSVNPYITPGSFQTAGNRNENSSNNTVPFDFNNRDTGRVDTDQQNPTGTPTNFGINRNGPTLQAMDTSRGNLQSPMDATFQNVSATTSQDLRLTAQQEQVLANPTPAGMREAFGAERFEGGFKAAKEANRSLTEEQYASSLGQQFAEANTIKTPQQQQGSQTYIPSFNPLLNLKADNLQGNEFVDDPKALSQMLDGARTIEEGSFNRLKEIASLEPGQPLPEQYKNYNLPGGLSAEEYYNNFQNNPKVRESVRNLRSNDNVKFVSLDQKDANSALMLPVGGMVVLSAHGESHSNILMIGNSTGDSDQGLNMPSLGNASSTNSYTPQKPQLNFDRSTGTVTATYSAFSIKENPEGALSVAGIKIQDQALEKAIRSGDATDSEVLKYIYQQDPNHDLVKGTIKVDPNLATERPTVNVNGKEVDLISAVTARSTNYANINKADGSSLDRAETAILDKQNAGLILEIALNPDNPTTQEQQQIREVFLSKLAAAGKNALNHSSRLGTPSLSTEDQRFYEAWKALESENSAMAEKIKNGGVLTPMEARQALGKYNFSSTNVLSESINNKLENSYKELRTKYDNQLVGEGLERDISNLTQEQKVQAYNELKNALVNKVGLTPGQVNNMTGVMSEKDMKQAEQEIQAINTLFGMQNEKLDQSRSSNLGLTLRGVTGTEGSSLNYANGTISATEVEQTARLLQENPQLNKEVEKWANIMGVPIDGLHLGGIGTNVLGGVLSQFLPAGFVASGKTTTETSSLNLQPEQIQQAAKMYVASQGILNNEQLQKEYQEILATNGNSVDSFNKLFEGKTGELNNKYYIDIGGKRVEFDSRSERDAVLQAASQSVMQIQANAVQGDNGVKGVTITSNYVVPDQGTVQMSSKVPGLEQLPESVRQPLQDSLNSLVQDANSRIAQTRNIEDFKDSGNTSVITGAEFMQRYGPMIGSSQFGTGGDHPFYDKNNPASQIFLANPNEKFLVNKEDLQALESGQKQSIPVVMMTCGNATEITKLQVAAITFGQETTLTPTTNRTQLVTTPVYGQEHSKTFDLFAWAKIPQNNQPEPEEDKTTDEPPKEQQNPDTPTPEDTKTPTEPTAENTTTTENIGEPTATDTKAPNVDANAQQPTTEVPNGQQPTQQPAPEVNPTANQPGTNVSNPNPTQPQPPATPETPGLSNQPVNSTAQPPAQPGAPASTPPAQPPATPPAQPPAQPLPGNGATPPTQPGAPAVTNPVNPPAMPAAQPVTPPSTGGTGAVAAPTAPTGPTGMPTPGANGAGLPSGGAGATPPGSIPTAPPSVTPGGMPSGVPSATPTSIPNSAANGLGGTAAAPVTTPSIPAMPGGGAISGGANTVTNTVPAVTNTGTAATGTLSNGLPNIGSSATSGSTGALSGIPGVPSPSNLPPGLFGI